VQAFAQSTSLSELTFVPPVAETASRKIMHPVFSGFISAAAPGVNAYVDVVLLILGRVNSIRAYWREIYCLVNGWVLVGAKAPNDLYAPGLDILTDKISDFSVTAFFSRSQSAHKLLSSFYFPEGKKAESTSLLQDLKSNPSAWEMMTIS
jgi:hypothetical protein